MLTLGKRRRRGTSVAVPEGSGGGSGGPRAVLSWGSAKRGVLALGYEIFGGFTPYPQAVVGVDRVVQAGGSSSNSAFVREDGSLLVAGENEGAGGAGNGRADVNVLTPELIAGGVPLYRKEELIARKRPSGKWTQPDGPIGPSLTGARRVVAIAGANGNTMFALLASGEVVGWGSGTEGVLGNGNPNNQAAAPVLYEPEGIWPQFAPWFVQTGGPALVPVISAEVATANEIAAISEATANAIKAEAEAKRITGIKALALGEKCGFLLGNDGEVYRTGQVAGDNTEYLYATRDDAWFKAKPGAGKKAVAIVASRYGYLVLLEDKTVRYVGVNHSGTWGNGSTVEISNVREVTDPGLSKVLAIAKGEYFCMVLKDDGNVWVWGGNEEGQLGMGLSKAEVFYAPKQVTTLTQAALGGKYVIAISAGGVKQGSGANNGDTAIALISDGTVRTWGSSWGFGDEAAEKYVPWGAVGDGTTETVGRADNTHKAPVQPLMPNGTPVVNVVGIHATCTHMLVIQEPATPGLPTLSATLAGKVATIRWIPIAGTLSTMLAPEGWKVVLKGPTKPTSGLLSAATTSWTSPELSSGEYEGQVEEKSKTEKLTVKGGTPHWKATAGKLTISWDAAVVAQPPGFAQIIEVQRTATYLDKSGKAVKEPWRRITPEAPGNLRTATFTLPSPSAHEFGAQDMEEVDARVSSNAEGPFGTRKFRFIVP